MVTIEFARFIHFTQTYVVLSFNIQTHYLIKSLIGFSAAVDVYYEKYARYPLHISTFVVFMKLKEAVPPSNSDLSVLEWLEVRATESEMSFFWILIFLLLSSHSGFHLINS